MRMQRIVPLVVSTCWQVPATLDKLTSVIPAPDTRPRPENGAVGPPVVTMTTPVVPSVPERFSTIFGPAVSEGSASQAPLGSETLTTQESEDALNAHPEVRSLTSWKRTRAFL